jgi:hypothetical protein
MDRIIQRESWCGFVVGRLSMTRWTTSQPRRLLLLIKVHDKGSKEAQQTMNEFSQVQKQKQARTVRKWHCQEECQRIASWGVVQNVRKVVVRALLWATVVSWIHRPNSPIPHGEFTVRPHVRSRVASLPRGTTPSSALSESIKSTVCGQTPVVKSGRQVGTLQRFKT